MSILPRLKTEESKRLQSAYNHQDIESMACWVNRRMFEIEARSAHRNGRTFGPSVGTDQWIGEE